MTQILIRRGTAAQWTSSNPVLGLGEIGYETDTRRSKVGDGASLWAALPYWIPTLPSGAVVGTNDSQVLTNKTISGASNTLTNVPTSALAINNSVNAYVSTYETTTSSSFTDLATTSDSVTATIGGSGMALVIVSAVGYSTVNNASNDMGFAVSGSSTVAAGTNGMFMRVGGSLFSLNISGTFLVTGLTSGSNTFKAKYRAAVNGGTATFGERRVSVIPL